MEFIRSKILTAIIHSGKVIMHMFILLMFPQLAGHIPGKMYFCYGELTNYLPDESSRLSLMQKKECMKKHYC